MSVLLMPELPPGRVLTVLRAPDPVLAAVGLPVDPGDPAVVRLAADLLATASASPGCVGLAAQQVGVALRVFSVDVSDHPKTRACHGRFVLCNAELLSATRRERGREGCLSVPDLTGDVGRARRLVVRGQLPGTGEVVTWRRTPSRPSRCSTRSTTPTGCSSSTGSRGRTPCTHGAPTADPGRTGGEALRRHAAYRVLVWGTSP